VYHPEFPNQSRPSQSRDRGRYFAVDHVDTNPYEAAPTLHFRTGIVRSVFALCFDSFLRTAVSVATILFLFASLTTHASHSSSTWSPGAVGNGRETREFGICPVVVIESAFDIDPDGVRRYLPSRYSLHADPVRGLFFLSVVTLLSFVLALILYPFWRRWAV